MSNSLELNPYCFECRKQIGNMQKHIKKKKHKTKLYQTNYDQLCRYGNCMHLSEHNNYCLNHQDKVKIKTKYKSLDDVRCPICKGVINSKWFNFRTGNVIEFIAECWSGNLATRDQPSHIFCFQIEVPDAILLPAKGSKVFEND